MASHALPRCAPASIASTARRTCSPGTRSEARAASSDSIAPAGERALSAPRPSFARPTGPRHPPAPQRATPTASSSAASCPTTSSMPAPRERRRVHGTGTDLVAARGATAHGVMVANLPRHQRAVGRRYCAMAMLMLARRCGRHRALRSKRPGMEAAACMRRAKIAGRPSASSASARSRPPGEDRRQNGLA